MGWKIEGVPVDGRARLVNIGLRRWHAMKPVRREGWMLRDYSPRPPTRCDRSERPITP